MRSYRFTPVWVFVLFASVIAVAELKSGRAGRRAQNRPANPPAAESVRMDKTADVAGQPLSARPSAVARVNNSDLAGFDAAASRNSELRTSLPWSFGGKQQRGWSLYAPLIANLTGSNVNAIESTFAMRLSLWQKQNNIEPNGVLDGDTWSRMISAFQS